MNRILTVLGVSLMVSFMMMGQEGQRIGEWVSYLPQNQGIVITQSPNNIIYGTPWSLILIDKETLEPRFLTKVDGLTEVGISAVQWDPYTEAIVVAYDDSNIDFVSDEGIFNVPNIALNTGINGDRRIYDIHPVNANLLYFATGFGIVSYDPAEAFFQSTTFTEVRVNQITSTDDYVYAATADGVYRIQKEATTIADFSTWDILGQESGLPAIYDAIGVELHNGAVYVAADGQLYQSTDEKSWRLIADESDIEIVYLQESGDRLITAWQEEEFKAEVRFYNNEGDYVVNGSGCSFVTSGAIRDESGRIWYGEEFQGIRWSPDYQSPCEIINYNAPYSHLVSDIVSREDEVLIASGGVTESFTFLFKREGMYHLENGQWTNRTEFVDSRLLPLEMLSIFRVAIHPSQPKLYGGSYWAGLLEYDKDADNYTVYNKTNSSLRGSTGDLVRERVTGLAFDEEENLWVATYNAEEPLNVFQNDGTWESFSVQSPRTLSDVMVDQNDYKWAPVFGNGGGILVFADESQQRFINTSNSELTTNLVNAVVEDRNGEIWVGTSEGPVVFDCGNDPFGPSCVGNRIQVVQDGIPAFLLADQDIRVMSVDGGNNKWFGTRNGLFVQSPDGSEEVLRFTIDNSPLFDNEITALSYQASTGVMFIGTNKGIQSYRTTTTPGNQTHREDEVYAFPNPVQPDYFGPIAIKGLVTDALVKITDIDGNLVSEVRAEGGQAIWDGRNLNGTYVSTGVYLVWSSEVDTFDAPDSYVTKVMIAR